jgi:hypothetical protein
MLGSVVPVSFVIARTDKIAVAVWGVTVFGTGFEFTVAALSRSPGVGFLYQMMGSRRVEPEAELPAELLRFGVACSDGSSATTLRPGPAEMLSAPEPTRVLMPGGGGGDDRMWTQKYWCWPLPPPGPISFVCEWPVHGIQETRHDIDAAPILAAAGLSTPIWE